MQTRAILLAALLGSSTHVALAGPPRDPQHEGAKVTTPSDKHETFAQSGVRSQIRAQRNVVARDEKAFAALWAEHAKQFDGTVPPTPKVDFKKYDIVAVFLGAIPTGGHSVEIGDIKPDGKKALIKATHLKPGPGMMVTQAFTSPFAMKAVPKLPPTVTFDITTTERK